MWLNNQVIKLLILRFFDFDFLIFRFFDFLMFWFFDFLIFWFFDFLIFWFFDFLIFWFCDIQADRQDDKATIRGPSLWFWDTLIDYKITCPPHYSECFSYIHYLNQLYISIYDLQALLEVKWLTLSYLGFWILVITWGGRTAILGLFYVP